MASISLFVENGFSADSLRQSAREEWRETQRKIYCEWIRDALKKSDYGEKKSALVLEALAVKVQPAKKLPTIGARALRVAPLPDPMRWSRPWGVPR